MMFLFLANFMNLRKFLTISSNGEDEWLKTSPMGNETMVSILDITTAFIYPIAFILFVVLLVCIERIEEMEDKNDQT